MSVSELVQEARNQLVSGTLLDWLRRQQMLPRLGELTSALEEDQRAASLYALGLVAETKALLSLLADNGIRMIALKGPLLSKQLYGDYAIRHPGDIDLLIDPARIETADELLRKQGYTRQKPRLELTSRRLDLYVRTQHEFGYRAPRSGNTVELHWRYADCSRLQPAPFDELWQRSVPVDLGGATARTLSPPDMFFQLAVHGFTDGWSRLKWIADLPRALAMLSMAQRGEIQASAARLGMGRIVELAFALAGAPNVPADTPWLVKSLRYVAWRLQNPHPRTFASWARAQHSVQANRFTNRLLENTSMRLSSAYCNLIMPSDFDRLRWPDALTPLLPAGAQLTRVWRSVRR